MKIDMKGVIVGNDDKWIYDYFEIGAVCPRDVIEKIDEAKGERIDTYINSGGGDVFAADEIYAALEAYEGEVRHHIVGRACSAASYIACSGKSDIVRTGMIMIHNVSGGASGDYHAMDDASELLQKANKAICAAYTHKTGMSEAELLTWMDVETWMTADEAVKAGFIDEIAKSKNTALVAAQNGLLPADVIEKIRNTVKSPRQQETDRRMTEAKCRLRILKNGGRK